MPDRLCSCQHHDSIPGMAASQNVSMSMRSISLCSCTPHVPATGSRKKGPQAATGAPWARISLPQARTPTPIAGLAHVGTSESASNRPLALPCTPAE